MNNSELQQLRQDYSQHTLEISEVDKNPFKQFKKWFNEAVASEVVEPNAMTISTVDKAHKPHSRIVLLKGFDENGFTFFTNYASDKGDEIEANPNVSLCFFWIELERQIRIEGKAEKLPRNVSENYFKSRPHLSQIGALTSNQSAVVHNREELDARFKELSTKYPIGSVPMPDTWGGYVIAPEYFEFWQGRSSRLHDRITYKNEGEDWFIQRLSP